MNAPDLPSLETLRAAEPALRQVLADTMNAYRAVLLKRGVSEDDLRAARDAALERLEQLQVSL